MTSQSKTCILLIFSLMASGIGCSSGPGGDHTTPVVLQVPEGYTGKLKVIYEAASPKPMLVGNEIRIQFDASGVAHIANDGSLNEWHRLIARYPSGKVIPMQEEGGGGRSVKGLGGNEKYEEFEIVDAPK